MKALFSVIVWIAMSISNSAMAQTWTLYAPPEGDFRVLMPAPPTRGNVADGGVEFQSTAFGDRYSVIRYDGRQPGAIDQMRDYALRRIRSDDRGARDTGQDRDLLPNEFELRVGGFRSVHRIVQESGRYYELVAQMNVDGSTTRMARDFFDSFQLGLGVGRGFSVLRNIPTPDSCQTRPNAFSRRFCEYLTCLAPGQESNPVCVALPRLAL